MRAYRIARNFQSTLFSEILEISKVFQKYFYENNQLITWPLSYIATYGVIEVPEICRELGWRISLVCLLFQFSKAEFPPQANSTFFTAKCGDPIQQMQYIIPAP